MKWPMLALTSLLGTWSWVALVALVWLPAMVERDWKPFWAFVAITGMVLGLMGWAFLTATCLVNCGED